MCLDSPESHSVRRHHWQLPERRPPEITPAFTADTVWDRTQPIAAGHRAAAWSSSGTEPSASGMDMNTDGIVNILELVWGASQFGTTSTVASDVNTDGLVNMQNLVWVTGVLRNVAARVSGLQAICFKRRVRIRFL